MKKFGLVVLNCKLCDKLCKSIMGLSVHIVTIHKLTSQQYYDKFFKNKNEGKCLKCKKLTNYRCLSLGYRLFCSHSCKYIGKFNTLYKDRILWKCSNCKTKLWLKPGRAKKRKFCSNKCLGKWAKLHFNKKLSIAMRKVRLKELENMSGNIVPWLKHSRRGQHGYFYSNKNKKEIWFASSYERKAFELLEQMLLVKSYTRCNFSIPYRFNGKNKLYIPDIFVKHGCFKNEIIEVKPKNLIKDGVVKTKIMAAKKYAKQNNLIFNVWTEKELKIF